MHLFPVGKVYDFMRYRTVLIGASIVAALASLVLIVYPGPLLGTDFQGGTEIEVAFNKPVTAMQIDGLVSKAGFSSPLTVRVNDSSHANHFLIRVQDVSTISEEMQRKIEATLCLGEGRTAAGCPENMEATEVKFSPGGDRITVRYRDEVTIPAVMAQLAKTPEIILRAGANNPYISNPQAHKVEIELKSKGDQLLDALRTSLGADTVPDVPLRSEWIGPKAGAQLRDSALKSVAIAIVFIMAYIALRFDLRFAPGAVVAMIHDSVVLIGILVIIQRLTGKLELNINSVAAVLTVVGYSVNDTVIVYDRLRENLGVRRGVPFLDLINISVSEMLGRTLIASGTSLMSLLAFFLWGTGTLREFAITLTVGIVLGTYSSIYVALPFTYWFDRQFFAKLAAKQPRRTVTRKAGATV